MNESNTILALFFSDESNLVFEEIKYEEELTIEQKSKLKMLPFQYLGPIFMTAANGKEGSWKIDFIEYSISLKQKGTINADVLQTFFALNSTIESKKGELTNLFALVGSSYTEDLKILFQKLREYVHPSIIQEIYFNFKLSEGNYSREKLIKEELIRGLHLMEYYLGSSRKIYWKEKRTYYCIGLIERKIGENIKSSKLYTFKTEDSIRRQILDLIPSFYVMAILPDYYENLLNDTLIIFDKKGIFPNLRQIDLTLKEKEVLYIEDFCVKEGIKRSIGCILIPLKNVDFEEITDIIFYQKKVRTILDNDEQMKHNLKVFNTNFSDFGWNLISDADLNQINMLLDNKN